VILCLGEAIVDLVCERELDSPAEADEFRPRFGGALANVAVAAARAGGRPALAGGVGEDPFGSWLSAQLAAEGVDTAYLSRVAGAPTPISVITFDRQREPHFVVYDEGIARTFCSAAARIEEAVGSAEAIVFGSNTLVGEAELELTMRARELALERGMPVLFDPNLREHRWEDLELARRRCLNVAEGAFCIRANEAEAAWLTGAADPARAAERLAGLGAQIAIATRGPRGAVARGAVEAEVAGIEVDVLSPLGAGDAFMGTLAAGYAKRGWDPAATPAAMAEANEAAARTCTVWQAVA
jgi:sugar/nucleoside kinase (ribokinase family)